MADSSIDLNALAQLKVDNMKASLSNLKTSTPETPVIIAFVMVMLFIQTIIYYMIYNNRI